MGNASAFPTLYPNGDVDWLHPRVCDIRLHEYALHLLRYFDQRFGSHPRFRYFLLNMIMRHRSQATAAVFVHKNIDDNAPITIHDLRQKLNDFPNKELAKHLMRFGSTLRGTRSYWTKCRSELTDMITQLGCPTLFFTLSAADTKWPDLHNLMPRNTHSASLNEHHRRIQNVIQYPHIMAMFMHQRFTIFREEVIQKHIGAKDLWYRYEWQHRGSAHVHGFLWLERAPNMDLLDWSNPSAVDDVKIFFDRYVTAWNPRDAHQRNIFVPRSINDDPCLLNTRQIFSSNPSDDYEHLINHVQRHTKCILDSCLRKKGSILTCRYNAPWDVRNESRLFIDEKVRKKYEPARNVDRANVHNVDLLAVWRANVDCQPVLCTHAVMNYIGKYASKSEKRSESYQDMLTRITDSSVSEDPVLCAYRRFLAETIVERDIGAQETHVAKATSSDL